MQPTFYATLLSGILLFSCRTLRLEQALQFSGSNRAELEKVAARYAQDTHRGTGKNMLHVIERQFIENKMKTSGKFNTINLEIRKTSLTFASLSTKTLFCSSPCVGSKKVKVPASRELCWRAMQLF